MAAEGMARQPSLKKSKSLPVIDWSTLVQPRSPLLAEVLADERRCDDLLVQLAAGLRGHGALASGTPTLRLAALRLFERHCEQLCRGAGTSRVRMVYETLRDHLGCPARDGAMAAAQLRDAAMRSLTQALVALDAPQRDPRLVKFHVEALFRLLDGTVASTDAAAGGAVGLMEQRRQLAVECLRSLEAAFPTLLYAEAGVLLQMAAKECSAPTSGLRVMQLSLDAVSHAAALHLRQVADAAAAEEAAAAAEFDAAADVSGGDSSEGEEAGVLRRAAEGLCRAGDKGGEEPAVDTPSGVLDQSFASARTDADEASSISRASASGAGTDAESTGCSTPTTDADAATASSRRRPSLAADLRRSALTSALRSPSTGSLPGGDGGAWTETSTPRGVVVVAAPLLGPPPSGAGLRRFAVPPHLQSGDLSDAPRLLLTPEAQLQLQHAVRTYLLGMRRLAPAAVAAVVAALPPVLRAARPSPTQLWPHLERLLIAGSTPLLRAVLDLHDEVPEMFEGRGPALVEKLLAQANDARLAVDHRAAAVSWLLRQHAAQRHGGGPLLLADCWEQLLPAPREPPALASLKVKALAACLAAGVGDEELACRAVCGWEGFASPRPSEQQLRALTYALRMLHGGQHDGTTDDGGTAAPARHRLHACLVTACLEMLVNRPALAPAVDAFAETSPPAFAQALLRAFVALLASVDGQFEALLARPEDAAYDGEPLALAQRVKAAVLSRSSSLSGLMRGLSFQLSFTRRTHSVMPLSARGEGPQRVASRAPSTAAGPINERARRQVDVGALRSSIAAAFHAGSPGRPGSQGINGQTQGRVGSGAPSAAAPSEASHLAGEGSMDGGEEEPEPAPVAAPPVPLDLRDWAAAEAWLSSPGTWEGLAPGLLRHDLMAYRSLMQRALRTPDIPPRGCLQTLANYTWQYKDPHPSHALPAKQTAAAVLALCHTAALTHLPWGGGAQGWGLRQGEVADSVQSVLDALEEGFPAPGARARSQVLGALLGEEAAWGPDGRAGVLARIVCAYIDQAVEG